MTLPSKVSDAVKKLNPELYFERVVVSPSLIEHYSKPTKADVKEEKELQKLCEHELTRRGYVRLTADGAEMVALQSDPQDGLGGWFGHWPNAKKNPLFPDLFICDSPMQNCLMVELKVVSRYTSGQKELIFKGCWHEVRSHEAFKILLDGWEQSCQP